MLKVSVNFQMIYIQKLPDHSPDRADAQSMFLQNSQMIYIQKLSEQMLKVLYSMFLQNRKIHSPRTYCIKKKNIYDCPMCF